MEPVVRAICPTYKQPSLVACAVQCLVDQTYTSASLLVCDDAGQFAAKDYAWGSVRTMRRFPSLPHKFNWMIDLFDADLYVIWEHDDVYLPTHIQCIVDTWQSAGSPANAIIVPSIVYTNYDGRGTLRIENAEGRFHAAYAYTRGMLSKVGGYPVTGALSFDQQMRHACGMHGVLLQTTQPTYVYRWGSGAWNGSQAGDAGYASLWESLGNMPCPWVGDLVPAYDPEALQLIANAKEQ